MPQGDALTDELGGADLARLSDRAGFIPKPVAQEDEKPGFRGAKSLCVFLLCNAIPLTALVYYLKDQRETRAQLSIGALPDTVDNVAAEVLRVIRTSATCFIVQDSSASGTGLGAIVRADPHFPEGTAYIPPTEPLPLVPMLQRNDITDLIESPKVPGLGFVHFALLKSSPLGVAIESGHRRASLLYVSNTRGAYCNVTGQISTLTDDESRRHYWKNSWAASFPSEPETVRPRDKSAMPDSKLSEEAERPPIWQNPEYMLVRLAVTEATLQSSVDGPGRWGSRRILRNSERELSSEGAWKWGQVAARI